MSSTITCPLCQAAVAGDPATGKAPPLCPSCQAPLGPSPNGGGAWWLGGGPDPAAGVSAAPAAAPPPPVQAPAPAPPHLRPAVPLAAAAPRGSDALVWAG